MARKSQVHIVKKEVHEAVHWEAGCTIGANNVSNDGYQVQLGQTTFPPLSLSCLVQIKNEGVGILLDEHATQAWKDAGENWKAVSSRVV